MATYYFDTNGATAGFGTLTGAWDTTSALWSTSSSGTSATAAVTFTNADVAQFGFAGTTATAGTATISTGITVTLNQITTDNLAGLQTIAAGGTGKLTLSGTTPTINVGSAGGLTVSAPIQGTGGFTKSGVGLLAIVPTTPANNTITGTINVTGATNYAGALTFGTTVGTANINVFPGNAGTYPTLNVSAANDWIRAYPNTQTTTILNPISGAGVYNLSYGSAGTVTATYGALGAGTLSGLNGTGGSSGTGVNIYPTSGFIFQLAAGQTTNITAYDVPAILGWWVGSTGTATTGSFTYAGSAANPTINKLWVGTFTATQTALATSTLALTANQNNANDPITVTNGILKDNDAGGNAVITLRGTHTGNNTIAGAISATAGTLGITKADAGKWILSGTNTYTGNTRPQGGTLEITNSLALQNSPLLLESADTGSISFTGSAATAATIGGLTQAATAKNYTIPAGLALTVKPVTGASLTYSGALTSGASATFTKDGPGTQILTGTNTGLAGTITVNAGTLTAGANGTTGDFGAAANNIVIASGATASVNRSNAYTISGNITPATTGGTFSTVTGAGTLTLSGSTISVGTLTHGAGTLEFSNAGAQAVSSAIGGAGNITKSGAGTTTFSTAGTNTGNWTINSPGTLAITASQTGGSGTITVSSGATLTSSAAASISKSITVANGGTATLNGNTSGALTISGNGVTFGSSGISTLSATSIFGATASIDTKVTIGTGRILTIADGNSLNVGSASASQSVLYVAGGTVNYNNINSSFAFNIPSTGSYGCLLVTNSGVVQGSGNQGLLMSLATAASLGAAGVIEVQSGSFAVPSAIVGSSTLSSSSIDRCGPFAMTIRSGTTNNTAGVIRLGGANIVSPYTFPSVLNVENGSVLVASGSGTASSSTADSASALVAMSIKGAGSKLELHSLTVSGASPKHINLIDGGTLVTQLAIGSVTAAPTLYLYGNSNKIGARIGAGTLWAPITPASGSGIISATFTGGGTGYIGPPVITVTGGGGTGAVVRPDFDKATGTITGLTVVCPGVNYTSAPTLTFSGGGVSAVAPTGITVNIGANATDGSVEKVEISNLSLTGTNTNTGTYTVTTNILKIGNGGAAGTLGLNDTSNAAIASGATLTFNRSDTRTYSGTISGAGNIAKETSSSTAILTANNSGLTGTVTVTAGALRATHANALGTGGSSVVVNSGGALELDGGITLARQATITGTGVSSGGALRSVSGNNSIGLVSLAATASIQSFTSGDTLYLTSSSPFSVVANLTFGGAGDVDVSQPIQTGAATVTKNGAGTAILRGTTGSYTGITTVSTGFLGYTGSIIASTAGCFGNASAAGNLLIAAGAGVRYYGTGGHTFSRAYTFQGGAATSNSHESNGSGAVTISTAPTYATTNVTKTLGLGGTGTATNTISYVIANNGTGAAGITKTGTGTWVASANNTATGAYAINGGTLTLQGTNTPASVAVSNSGSVLVLENATGAARTGTATVTINANAKVQTLTGSTQNGRMTYQNLTFAANGRIRIGG